MNGWSDTLAAFVELQKAGRDNEAHGEDVS